MKLAVVCGRKSEDIKKRLLSIHDNLQIDAYEDIDTLITNSIQRQYFYDRILFASHIIRGDEMGNFQTFAHASEVYGMAAWNIAGTKGMIADGSRFTR